MWLRVAHTLPLHSNNETELAALTQQVNSAATTYQQATDRVNELNEQISEMADEILKFPAEQAARAAAEGIRCCGESL